MDTPKKTLMEGSDLGVPAPERAVGLSVPSPQPSASGLSTAIPNAKRLDVRKAEDFIMRWVTEDNASGKTFSVVDSDFHDCITHECGGKQVFYAMGCAPNRAAMKLAADLWKRGWLTRKTCGLRHHITGFPNWVWVYEYRNFWEWEGLPWTFADGTEIWMDAEAHEMHRVSDRSGTPRPVIRPRSTAESPAP